MMRGLNRVEYTRRNLTAAFLLLICWVGVLGCNAVTAQTGLGWQVPGYQENLVLIPPPKVNVAGFRVEVVMGAESTTGYAPAGITFTATATFSADRQFVVRFTGGKDLVSPPRRNLEVDVPLTVLQGNKSQSFVRYIPRWAVVSQTKIEILEDGRLIENYVGFSEGGNARIMGRGSNPTLELLSQELGLNAWLLGGLQDVNSSPSAKIPRKLNSWRNGGYHPSENWFLTNPYFRTLQNFSLVHVDEAPTDWRAYQRTDTVLSFPPIMESLSKNSPRANGALRQWLMMGGTLIVVGSDSSEGPLNSLRVQRLLVDAAESSPVIAAVAQNFPFWSEGLRDLDLYMAEANRAEAAKEAPDWYSVYQLQKGPMSLAFDGSESLDECKELIHQGRAMYRAALARSPQQWADRIWYQPIGAGLVIGLPGDIEQSQFSAADLQVVQRLIGYRKSPALRRGVDPMIGSPRFRDWLIDGVAQPPVYTFMGLLTAFVILVGPVAYRQTSKRGKSHLMFLIAPALALVTTGLMFGYGVVADGFGTSARVRQVTLVDARSGDAVERIRSTYFAGIRPSEGLTFPGQAEVMSSPESKGKSWESQNLMSEATAGRVVIQEDSQWFEPRFLPSRQQTQFVVHQPKPRIGRLIFSPASRAVAPKEPASPNTESGDVSSEQAVAEPLPGTVTNTFEFPLHQMILRDPQGTYWSVESLEPKQPTRLTLMDPKTVSKEIGKLYNDYRPIMKTRVRSSGNNITNEVLDVINELRNSTPSQNAPNNGCIESLLQTRLQTMTDLPHGYFIGLTDPSDDAIVVRDAEIVSSVRYVMGTYAIEEGSSP